MSHKLNNPQSYLVAGALLKRGYDYLQDNLYTQQNYKTTTKMGSHSYSKRRFKKPQYKRKRFHKKTNYKKQQKNWISKLNRATVATQPYVVSNSQTPLSWSSAAQSTLGNSEIFGVDVGLNRWTPTAGLGLWTSTVDDIPFCVQAATAGVVNNINVCQQYNNDVRIERMDAKICLRNNSNVGVLCEVYYFKRKKNNSSNDNTNDNSMRTGILSAMNDSFVTPPVIPPNITMGYADSFYNYPQIGARFTFKKLKSFIFYPAMTKFFNLKCPIAGKTFKPTNACARTIDPRWHRSLIFRFNGLPVHNSTDADFIAGTTAYGEFKIDGIISRVVKYRRTLQPTEDDYIDIDTTRIVNIPVANQEIQPAVNPTNSLLTS